MKKISIFLKGILIGFVSLAIPGVSASTIAILLGIYYVMIDAISSIFKNFKQSVLFLICLLAGFGLGSLVGANLISIIYDKYPFVVVLTILGFILGSLPSMIKKVSKGFKNFYNILILIIVFAVVLGFSFLTAKDTQVTLSFNMPLKDYILLFLVGFITSGTLVVPGMDFAIVLLALGYYEAFISLLNVTDMSIFLGNMAVLAVYLIAYGIGSFLLSKVIKKITNKHQMQMDFAILSFVLVSPIILVKQGLVNNASFDFKAVPSSQFVIGALLLILSFLIVLLIHHLNNPNDKRIKAMKKRNMFRLYFTIVIQFPVAIYYLIKMRKVIKENKATKEERYALVQKVLSKINKWGNIHVLSYGIENVPKDEGVLFVINHQGRYDGLAVLTALKDFPVSNISEKSRVHFPLFYETFLLLNGEYVDKTNMREQVIIINNIGKRLQEKDSFLAFVEGKYGDNGNTLQEFQTGLLHPAYQSHCKVIPIVLYDTYKVFGISSIRRVEPQVHILKPICYEEYKDLSKKQFAEEIKSLMQDKLDEINQQMLYKKEKIKVG